MEIVGCTYFNSLNIRTVNKCLVAEDNTFIFKFFYTRGYVLDTTLGFFGIPLDSLPFWLRDVKLNNWSLVATSVWKYMGQNMVLFAGAIMSVDPNLYEAAAIDGAGRFQRILNVTLPGIKSTFVVLLIMNIGHLMEAGFEIQYLLGNKQVYDFSQTLDVFVLEFGIQNNKYGRAIAAGMFKSVVGILLLFGANFVAKKMDEDTLL